MGQSLLGLCWRGLMSELGDCAGTCPRLRPGRQDGDFAPLWCGMAVLGWIAGNHRHMDEMLPRSSDTVSSVVASQRTLKVNLQTKLG